MIDKGDTGGQSERSSGAKKLTFCSPLGPAQHISLVMHLWSCEDIQEFCRHDAWETGQEDLPSACHYCLGCVVFWFHGEWQEPAYQVYSGLLFGLPLAVTSFNRFSQLVEALSRRVCRYTLTMPQLPTSSRPKVQGNSS